MLTRTLVRDLTAAIGSEVRIEGWVLTRRDLGGISFAVIRDRSGVVQCVFQHTPIPLQESAVRVVGTVVEQRRAPGGIEIQATSLEVISEATAAPPVEINKESYTANQDTLLAYRHVSVRSHRTTNVLRVLAGLVHEFRAGLRAEAFTEIFTPKLVSAGAEGGANMFEVDFYGKRGFLAQSPQLYKQIMVAVHERVFETAPVYRAEKSHTLRHLSEYVSLDAEFAFIHNEHEVMDVEEQLLKRMFTNLARTHEYELTELGATLPEVATPFPRIPLLEAREIVATRYGHQPAGKDLDPEGERLISKWALEEHDSEFVFLTDFPAAARPFYTYPNGDGTTRGFDLIFRGVEITSGGQRAHHEHVLREELAARNLDPEQFADYLAVFRHGMPPHGGFAIGAERLTALTVGIENVRFATAFPRDSQRLKP